MIDKVLQNLKKPNRMIKKIIQKIQTIYFKRRYKIQEYEKNQNQTFNDLGISREEGILKLNKIEKKYELRKQEMSSEHQVLFSAISLKNHFSSILEIGTYDGENAFLLSKLFDGAKIDTIDLEENEKNFKESYGRNEAENFKKFCLTRDKTLSLSNNINFEKKNSLSLTFENKKYDLIWIDGAHGYPVVTIDIINSLRMIDSGGIIVCDDVWKHAPLDQDSMYNSIATFETLESLKKSNLITYSLIFKRLDKENNSNYKLRKYIAYIKVK